MRAPRTLPLLLAAATAACGPEFTPRSVLFDLRVLAIVAEPLEAGLDEPVTLTAHRFVPEGDTVLGESWSFCPFSIGALDAYRCAVPCVSTFEVPVRAGTGESASVTANPGQLALECATGLAGPGGLPADPALWPERVDGLFTYTVKSRNDASGRETERIAVQRLPIYPRGKPAGDLANVKPELLSVTVDGATVTGGGTAPAPLVPGGALAVVANVAGAQPYVDGDRRLTESLVVSFYTTAGRFDFDRANGPAASVRLEHDEIAGETEAELWVVARDLRGGQTVGGPYRVPIAP